MARIRVGSVGLGGISRGVHLPGIAASPDLELVALCDISEEALRSAREAYGIAPERCFADYRDLVACNDVDVVDISTPNDVHFDVAMAAAQAGKPFCIEKPLTLTAQQADALADAVERYGVKTMVCFSYRYKAAARYARDLVRNGTLGKIYHVDMEYSQAWGLPSFNTPRVWRFHKAETGSGALGDLGSHALDLVRFVTGEEYERVVGHAETFVKERKALCGDGMAPVDVDDFSNMLAQMSSGIAASFRITRFAYGRGNYQRMVVYGEKGSLVYLLDENGAPEDTLDVCLDPLGAENHMFVRVPIPQRYRVDQMQSFADILLNKADDLSATVADGRANMHAVDAALASVEKGEWVDITG